MFLHTSRHLFMYNVCTSICIHPVWELKTNQDEWLNMSSLRPRHLTEYCGNSGIGTSLGLKVTKKHATKLPSFCSSSVRINFLVSFLKRGCFFAGGELRACIEESNCLFPPFLCWAGVFVPGHSSEESRQLGCKPFADVADMSWSRVSNKLCSAFSTCWFLAPSTKVFELSPSWLCLKASKKGSRDMSDRSERKKPKWLDSKKACKLWRIFQRCCLKSSESRYCSKMGLL